MKTSKPQDTQAPKLRRRRGAFTLMELMVSVALLAGVMVMIGYVFSTAGKASGRARSDSVLYRRTLQAADVIRRDLEGVAAGPGGDMLAIAGVEVLAYNSPEDETAAGGLPPTTPHRADVLMMITSRPFEPFIFKQPGTPVTFGAPKQVVYGHADLGRIHPNGAWITGSIRRVEGTSSLGSDMPASEWHLARRVIGFPSVALGPSIPGVHYGSRLAEAALLDGTADVFNTPLPFVPELQVSGMIEYAGSDTLIFLMDSSNGYRKRGNSDWLLRGADSYWYRWDNGTNHWMRDEGTAQIPLSPSAPEDPTFDAGYVAASLLEHFYNPSAPPDPNGAQRRTLLDPQPPLDESQRIASYFLPACSDFRVEYTYDDPRELLMIDDGTQIQIDAWDRNFDAADKEEVSSPHPIRWESVPNGQQRVWSRLSVEPDNRTDPHRWPRALRIIIRAYGSGGASQGAVEQTIIHCWPAG